MKWARSAPEAPENPPENPAQVILCGEPTRADQRVLRSLSKRFPKHAVIVSCVVPALKSEVQEIFSHQPLHIVSGDSPFLNFSFDYPQPAELGADRLADSAAMVSFGKFPAVSINCGTATVLNVLDKQGRFCGGLIQPGLEVIRDSILRRAAGLRVRKFVFPAENESGNQHSALGKSTQQAIHAGALAQFRGGIQHGLKTISHELRENPYVYLTGGNAPWLPLDSIKHVNGTIETKALLTLEGLNIIARRWRASQSMQ